MSNSNIGVYIHEIRGASSHTNYHHTAAATVREAPLGRGDMGPAAGVSSSAHGGLRARRSRCSLLPLLPLLPLLLLLLHTPAAESQGAAVVCTRPVLDYLVAGYDLAAVNESSLAGCAPGCSAAEQAAFAVTGVVCDAGYSGVAAAAACTVHTSPYMLSGCTAMTCVQPTAGSADFSRYNLTLVNESSLSAPSFGELLITPEPLPVRTTPASTPGSAGDSTNRFNQKRNNE